LSGTQQTGYWVGISHIYGKKIKWQIIELFYFLRNLWAGTFLF